MATICDDEPPVGAAGAADAAMLDATDEALAANVSDAAIVVADPAAGEVEDVANPLGPASPMWSVVAPSPRRTDAMNALEKYIVALCGCMMSKSDLNY